LLQPHLSRVKQAFADKDRGLLERLASIYAADRVAAQEAEWEINKRLKG